MDQSNCGCHGEPSPQRLQQLEALKSALEEQLAAKKAEVEAVSAKADQDAVEAVERIKHANRMIDELVASPDLDEAIKMRLLLIKRDHQTFIQRMQLPPEAFDADHPVEPS